MKRYVKREVEVETTTEISHIVGFLTTRGEKGTLVYVGELNTLHAIVCDNHGQKIANSSCGKIKDNRYKSVEDFIKRSDNVFKKSDIDVAIKDFFFFDTVKELYRWLSE